MEYRIASTDDVRAIALLRWEATAKDGPVEQPREDFAAAFVEWADAVRTTHIAFPGTRPSMPTPAASSPTKPTGGGATQPVARSPLPTSRPATPTVLTPSTPATSCGVCS